MTKKKALVNERVIRRWGKLANMAPLTENFIDTLEEEEDDMDAGMEADAGDMDMGDAPAEAGEEEAVERIVSAVVDAISQETGVDIEVEGDAAGGEMEMEMDDDPAGMDDDPAMMDDEAGMRDHGGMPANRDDDLHERGNPPPPQKDDDDGKHSRQKDDDEEEHGRGKKKVKKEELDLEVIDDEELTEAVLQRVVERLLKRQ